MRIGRKWENLNNMSVLHVKPCLFVGRSHLDVPDVAAVGPYARKYQGDNELVPGISGICGLHGGDVAIGLAKVQASL